MFGFVSDALTLLCSEQFLFSAKSHIQMFPENANKAQSVSESRTLTLLFR